MVRAIQAKLLVGTIGISDHHIETAAQCDNDFFLGAVGVPTSGKPARHVVRPEDPGDLEREVVLVLEERKITSRITNNRKSNNFNMSHCSCLTQTCNFPSKMPLLWNKIYFILQHEEISLEERK